MAAIAPRLTLSGGLVSHCHEWLLPATSGRKPTNSGLSLVFLHATGFHARVWDATVSSLLDQLPATSSISRVIGVDLIGHGRSSKPWPPEPAKTWSHAAEVVEETLLELKVERCVLVGHSAGAFCAARIAAVPEPAIDIAAMMLIDPVICEPLFYTKYAGLEGDDLNAALHARYGRLDKRFNDFESPVAMLERFSGRPPFSLFDKRCLDSYVEHALLPVDEVISLAWQTDPSNRLSPEQLRQELVGPQGAKTHGLTLACPPPLEAQWYMGTALNPDLHQPIRDHVRCPVALLRTSVKGSNPDGSVNFLGSPTSPELGGCFSNLAEDTLYDDLTHFIPLQQPEMIASKVLDLVEQAGVGGEARRARL